MRSKQKQIISVALAATPGLGVCAYAVWDIHQIRSSETAIQAQEPNSVFGSFRSADGTYVPINIRKEAAQDLERNLRGIHLTKANQDALNSQIYDIGLEVNAHGKIRLISQEEYARILDQRKALQEEKTWEFMADNAHKFEMQVSRYATSMPDEHVAMVDLNTSVVTEEEEEEELVSTTPRQARIALRQKLLATWLLTTLDDSLKKSMRYKGRRPAGSEYIQELLHKYENR